MSLVHLRAVVALGAVAAASGMACAHEEVMVGRNAAGQLQMHSHAIMPFRVPASVFPGIGGFATAEIALASLDADDPAEDLFTLPGTVDIRCVLLATSANMRVYNGVAPMRVGDQMALGAPVIHYLPVWNITQGSPGDVSFAVFNFHDASGQLTDSGPFVVTFTPEAVPAPGAAWLAGAGVAFAARRRRRARAG